MEAIHEIFGIIGCRLPKRRAPEFKPHSSKSLVTTSRCLTFITISVWLVVKELPRCTRQADIFPFRTHCSFSRNDNLPEVGATAAGTKSPRHILCFSQLPMKTRFFSLLPHSQRKTVSPFGVRRTLTRLKLVIPHPFQESTWINSPAVFWSDQDWWRRCWRWSRGGCISGRYGCRSISCGAGRCGRWRWSGCGS
jgi:hypothetical protein